MATYHAYAGRLLRDHGLRIGVEPGARLLADATRFQLAESVLRRAAGPFDALDKTVPYLVGEIVALDGELSEHLVTTEQLRDHDVALVREIGAVAKPVADVLKARDAALQRAELAQVVDLLRQEKVHRSGCSTSATSSSRPSAWSASTRRWPTPSSSATRSCSSTNTRTPRSPRRSCSRRSSEAAIPVTAVGDPCQAIYGWRGASVGNIDAFPVDFPRADGAPAQRFDLVAEQPQRRPAAPAGQRAVRRAAGPPPGAPRAGTASRASRPRGAPWSGCSSGSPTRSSGSPTRSRASSQDPGTRPRDIAVLVRVRADFAPYHDALVARGIPVEVVGLGGLLALPEVADLVATLDVLVDATANTSLVRLLTGPRWRIGPRDLVLLGRRAADLVRVRADAPDPDDAAEVDAGADVDAIDVEQLLEEAVAGVDPAEVVSLTEALERPGGAAYSPEARERFARLDSELRGLRRHVGDPLLDLLHRVLATTGLDVEVGAAPNAPRTRRSEALASFLDHAAAFADLDGDAGVRAFLAFLAAADRFERGLDTAAPTSGDTVKLMTVHKAKGLEWPIVVVPDVTRGVFPSGRGRSSWTTSGSTLPTGLRGDSEDFPDSPEWSTKGLAAFKAEMKSIDELEERRLAYVALTRAKHTLVVTGSLVGSHAEEARAVPRPTSRRSTRTAWPATGRSRCGPRSRRRTPTPGSRRLVARASPGRSRSTRTPSPSAGTPATSSSPPSPPCPPCPPSPPPRPASPLVIMQSWWPSRFQSRLQRRLRASRPTSLPRWMPRCSRRGTATPHALLEEARALHTAVHDVPVPAALSASSLVRLAADPGGLARDLARPMPRPPAPAARRGTRFHGWVEGLFGAQPLLDRSDLEGAADDDLVDDADLGSLQAAFLAGPYATTPPHRIEAPFQLVLGGRVVRGRIDAVYLRPDGGYDVVDWKTGTQSSDPLQLAVYRAAWAQIAGVPEAEVGAAFYYVGSRRGRPPRRPARGGRADRPGQPRWLTAARRVAPARSMSRASAQWSLTSRASTCSARTSDGPRPRPRT